MRKLVGLMATAAILAASGGLASAQDTIKIGVTQPLTGAFAASGNYVAQGAKIAEDEINAAGGVLGKKIQLVIEDNKSNPTEAVSTVEKLIQRDKVPVLMPMVTQVCDRIVVLNYGRIIAEGTPAEIQSNPDVIRAYLGQGKKRA